MQSVMAKKKIKRTNTARKNANNVEKQKIEYICLSSLKTRGWTPTLISTLLPEPKLVKNPHYSSASEMKLWDKSVVIAAESSPEFVEHKEKRQVREQKAADVKNVLISSLLSTIDVNDPAKNYPFALQLNRHFVICVGGTNTGKTYRGIEALKKADNGIYLAPLRLLAMEVQDTLLSAGVLCSMITGEEENVIPGSTVLSATVEMLDTEKIYDVGVIDECQMIEDKERGGSWTRAILGLAAEKIYLCMSENALDICIRLIRLCGDTYEVVRCERKTPLEFVGTIGVKDLRPGDALILFSRKGVLNYASDMNSLKLYTSVIYGALPYKSRKQQVEQYVRGETPYVVSTDAIGMGLNLPIRRIVFAEDHKFDGESRRGLYVSEVLQIAGRAGRYGMYDKGEVAVLKEGEANEDRIRTAMRALPKEITKVKIPFPEEFIKASTEKVSKLVEIWKSVEYPEWCVQQDVTVLIDRLRWLEKTFPAADRELIYKFATVAFDESNERLMDIWQQYCVEYFAGEDVVLVCGGVSNFLENNELSYKQLDLYYGFCKAAKIPVDNEMIVSKKEEISKQITKLLADERKSAKKRTCAYCGHPIPFSRFTICESCYRSSRYDRW